MKTQFSPNYIKCPRCNNTLDLSFVNKSCPNPLCVFNFEGLDKLLNEDEEKLRKAIAGSYKGNDDDRVGLIATAIKYNIGDYLSHFIECTWGAHCNSIYKDFILLHLKDLHVLKKVLSSDAIKEGKDNIIVSKNGYKMFWELYEYLIRVNHAEIRSFLRTEFPKYWREWYKKIHNHAYKKVA